MQNLYHLLGVRNFASFEELVQAYKKKHTELFSSESPLANIPKLRELKDAFDLLSDEKKRLEYDSDLADLLEELEESYDQALELLTENHLADALKQIHLCINRSPGEPDYYETMGLIYRLMGDLDNSLRSYKQGLNTGQRKGIFHRYIADIYQLKGDQENADTHFLEAAEAFKEVLKVDPKNAVSIEQLADVYSKIKFYEESIELYLQLVRLSPYNATYHRSLGAVYYEVELYEEAEKHLLASLRISPGDASALLFLGLVYFKQRLLKMAIQTIQDSLKINPDQPEAVGLINQIKQIRSEIGKTVEEITYDPAPDAYVEGTVKWYNPESGIGIATCEQYPEVLLHYTAINPKEEPELKRAVPIKFGVVKDKMSPVAVNVELLEQPTASDVTPGKIEKYDLNKQVGTILTYDNNQIYFEFSVLSKEVLDNITKGLDVLVESSPITGLHDEQIQKAIRVRLRKRLPVKTD